MAAIPATSPATGVLTSPFMKKMNTPTSQEDANMAVIGGLQIQEECDLAGLGTQKRSRCKNIKTNRIVDAIHSLHVSTPSVKAKAVIAVVFLTLLSVVGIIVVYLYKNKGNYHTYEQPEADPEGSVQMEDFPCKREKEEYFI